jgi:hypothetical protein
VLDDGAALAMGLSSGALGGADPARTALWRAFLEKVARELMPAGVPIRALVGFLADGRVQGPGGGGELEAAEADLGAQLEAMARAAAGPPAPPPPERLARVRCRALRCGFERFCHGPKTRASEPGPVL